MNLVMKTKEEVEAFLSGCAFYGTGGGGDTAAGRVSLYRCLDEGREIVLTDPATIDDDALYCNAFFMGSIAPRTPEVLEEMKRNGFTDENIKYELEDILAGAVKTLEKYLGKKISALIVAEPGGSNTACCMAAAYKLGIACLDGDSAGRAIPEMENGLCCIRGYDCLPAAYCDAWGNKSLTLEAASNTAMERVGKFLSQASYGLMGEAAYVLPGKMLKNVFMPYTLSRCFEVGKAIKAASRETLLADVAKAADGKIVAKGVVHDFKPVDANGYYSGTYEITGQDEFAGNEYKIWFKNENHVIWKNGKPLMTSPDLISLVSLDSGEPVLNSYVKEGDHVGVIVTRCHDFYHEPASIASFGPRYFGFDFDFKPFEEVEV